MTDERSSARKSPKAIQNVALDRAAQSIAETELGRRIVDLTRAGAIEAVARGFTAEDIRRAAAADRLARDGQPRRDGTATILRTSVSTLDRAMKELGMEPWPPRAPRD